MGWTIDEGPGRRVLVFVRDLVDMKSWIGLDPMTRRPLMADREGRFGGMC